MKAIWKGNSNPLELINGKEYEVLGTAWDDKFLNVIDETGEACLYPTEDFEIIIE